MTVGTTRERTCLLENRHAPLKPKSVAFSRDGRFAVIALALNVAASVPRAANEKSKPANANAPSSGRATVALPAASYWRRRSGSLNTS